MEKSELPIEKNSDLDKYSNIFFDFLGPCKASSSMSWYVVVALDKITIAKFQCKTCGTYKCCRLKKVNGKDFDGDVQFHFIEYDKKVRNPYVKIYIRSLYVADYSPRISGELILNLVKKMTDSRQPDVFATLDDVSNVKTLSLLATGLSYYEHFGFHYVNRDGTRMTQVRNNFQKTNINAILLVSCVSQKLDERMQDRTMSFRFDEPLKQEILEALRKEIGRSWESSRQLGDFWKIYRAVMKSVDFYALKDKFDEHLQQFSIKNFRIFKNLIFTRYLRECLQQQIMNKYHGIFGFSALEQMSYP